MDSRFQVPDSRFVLFGLYGVIEMATIERFEDLEVWKLAFENANIIYDLTMNEAFSRDYPLRDQVRRCAISVFSNIA